jgi:hypothetical protein
MADNTTHLISQAPDGWTNVVPAEAGYTNTIATCTQLMADSSSINADANTAAGRSAYDKNIRRQRAALWLRDDQQPSVTLAFNVLDGPTKDHPERCPKFLVCGGISQAVYDQLSNPFTGQDATYQSIRNAVIYFAENNQDQGRLFLWVEDNKQPQSTDWIYPIFQWAIYNDLALAAEGPTPESPVGVPEDYSNQDQLFAGHRWTIKPRTWKLKRWQDA